MNLYDLFKNCFPYGKTYNFVLSNRNTGKTLSQNQMRVKRIKRKIRNRQLNNK